MRVYLNELLIGEDLFAKQLHVNDTLKAVVLNFYSELLLLLLILLNSTCSPLQLFA